MPQQATLDEALQARDFAAAQTIIKLSGLPSEAEAQWSAWLQFHSGAVAAALDAYRQLACRGTEKSYDLHLAACLFQLRRYEEAQAAAEQGPECALRTRLLAHCAAKLHPGAEAAGAAWEEREAALASGGIDDQLSLAALHYERCEYGAAGAIYDGLLARFPDLHALHAYRALCLFMEGDWQAAGQHVAAYQAQHPESLLSTNLRACCEFRAGGPGAALRALGTLPAQLAGEGGGGGGGGGAAQPHAALVCHNAVVFSDGQGGLQVLPPLLEAVPEARLNLALLHCRRGDPARALALLAGLQPATALEHICLGVAAALQGQAAAGQAAGQAAAAGGLQGQAAALLARAQECFQAVGSSPTELDSVPGRQCLASAALLGPAPEEALPLLESLVEVCEGDDALSWNLGMARAAAGEWALAADTLLAVQRADLLADPAHPLWLARCLVRGGRPEDAWQLGVAAQQQAGACRAVADLLHLIAAECFAASAWLWAARAFHALEHLQQQGAPLPAAAAAGGAWEGKRAAVAQLLRAAMQGQPGAAAALPEVMAMLRGSSHPQALAVAAAVRQWMEEGQALADGAAPESAAA